MAEGASLVMKGIAHAMHEVADRIGQTNTVDRFTSSYMIEQMAEITQVHHFAQDRKTILNLIANALVRVDPTHEGFDGSDKIRQALEDVPTEFMTSYVHQPLQQALKLMGFTQAEIDAEIGISYPSAYDR